MNSEIWQQLLSLENRDITHQWFKQIHSRELSARRAREINAAAKQGREYFRNANSSNYSVRPLLTFYGVASLSRSLLLMLKANGGEEGLTASHGLETVSWGNTMSGDIAIGLQGLRDLKIRTRLGLFSDFVRHTNNRISLHVNSSGVNWRLPYDIPSLGQEFSVADLLSRIPDLHKDYSNVSNVVRYASIDQMAYSKDAGFSAKIRAEPFSQFQDVYERLGYTATPDSDWVTLTCDADPLRITSHCSFILTYTKHLGRFLLYIFLNRFLKVLDILSYVLHIWFPIFLGCWSGITLRIGYHLSRVKRETLCGRQ